MIAPPRKFGRVSFVSPTFPVGDAMGFVPQPILRRSIRHRHIHGAAEIISFDMSAQPTLLLRCERRSIQAAFQRGTLERGK